MKNWLLCFVFLSCISSCYYDVEDDFRQNEDCISATITYSDDILAIVSSRCYKCHAANLNLGNVTLEGYNKIKIYVDNGRLLGAVKREVGFSPMPQNETMLPECDITKIETWINSGAPNN